MVTKNPKIGLRHKCKTEIRTGSNQAFFSISEQTARGLSFSSDLVRGVRASASVERRSRERRETRALVTRVVICVSRTFYSTDQEKRETARSLISETRVFFQNSHQRHMHPPSLLWGTFHLSKLTGQKIAVIMIISLVIRTIHRDPKWHARRNGVSTKTLGKKRFLLSK